MKRMPLLVSFLALVVLSASLAYWALQWYKPAQRPIAAVRMQAAPEPQAEAARGLFGGQVVTAAVSNYQLHGVVAAGNGRGSVAIIAADGKPAKAYPVGAEVASGVTVRDVLARAVVLSEGGVPKRLELMPDTGANASSSIAPPVMPLPPIQPVQPQPQQPAPPAAPVMTPSMGTGVQMPPPVSGTR